MKPDYTENTADMFVNDEHYYISLYKVHFSTDMH